MQRRLKIKLSKLLVIIISWMVVGLLISFYDYFLMSCNLSLGYSPGFNLQLSIFFNLIGSFTGAVIGGSFLVFYINEKYREKSYGSTILIVGTTFFVVVSLVTVFVGFGAALAKTGKSLSDEETIGLAKANIFNPIHLKSIIVWGFVLAITQLLLSVDLKFGQGLLWHFIKGKYHQPRKEKRIFMFLDINSSTAIAERLGNEKYHHLLKDFFSDITNPVLDHRGEIYQYAGDEVIISWRHGYGIKENRCIQCYFDIKKHIELNKEKYLSEYGVVPSFKAALHSGNVIAGEVGIIKRDVTFSGDVLNTASRMQGMCKELRVDLLVSEELTNELPKSRHYISKSMGANKLRGKEKNIELVTMELAFAS